MYINNLSFACAFALVSPKCMLAAQDVLNKSGDQSASSQIQISRS